MAVMEWVLPGSVERHRVVPWTCHDEWAQVYFSAFHGSPELAVEMVRRWRQRGPLPISVDTTAMLLETIIDSERLSETELRLAIAMAIIRLVNGIADREQNSLYAKSIREIARSLQMPVAFVEVRHAATHNDLPSLQLLIDTRHRALDWLHDCYWKPHDLHARSLLRHGDVDLFSALQTATKSWRKSQQDKFDRKLESVLTLISNQCPVRQIAELFVGPDFVLRQPRSGIDLTPANVESAFATLSNLWSDVISYLTARLPDLMSVLVLHLFRITRDSDGWRQALAGRWLAFGLMRCRLPHATITDLCLRSRSSLILGAFEEYCSKWSPTRVLDSVGKTAMTTGSSLMSAFLIDPGVRSRAGDLGQIEQFAETIATAPSSVRNRWIPVFQHGGHIPIGLLPDGSMPDFSVQIVHRFGENVLFPGGASSSTDIDDGLAADDEPAVMPKRRRTESEPIDSNLIALLR